MTATSSSVAAVAAPAVSQAKMDIAWRYQNLPVVKVKYTEQHVITGSLKSSQVLVTTLVIFMI